MAEAAATNSTPAPDRRRAVAVGAAIGLVCAAGAVLGCREIASPDLGWHLSYARWIVDHGSVPTTDPLTYTVTERAATNPQWAFQLIVYAVMSIGGPTLLTLATTAATLGFAGLMMWRTKLRERALPLAVAPLLLLFFLANSWEIRPHIASWLLGSVVLLIMEAYDRGDKRWLKLLPLVMLIWVNLHAVFILGLVIIASYVVAHVLVSTTNKRSIDRTLLLLAGGSVLACLVSPYHVKALLLPFAQFADLQSGSVFKSATTGTAEYLSPFRAGAYNPPDAPFRLFHSFFFIHLYTAVSVIGALGAIKRARLVDWILFAGFIYLMAGANKNFGFFVMVTLPLVAGGLANLTRLASASMKRTTSAIGWGVGWSATAALCLALAGSGWLYSAGWTGNRTGFGINELASPVGACAFMNEHNIEGRVLNSWNDGGYIAWATGQPVFIYGRGRVMGPDFYSEYVRLRTVEGPAGFEAFKAGLSKWQPGVVVVRFSVATSWLRMLNALGDWRLVYADETTAVFCHDTVAPEVPAIAPPQPGIDYPAIDQATLAQRVANVTALGSPGFGDWLAGRRAYPTQRQQQSRFYFETQQWQACIGVSLAGLEQAGFAVPDLLLNLGHSFDALKQYRSADLCYDAYMRSDPNPTIVQMIHQIRAQRQRRG